MVGLIDVLGESQAILIGHDWGASIAYAAAILHPERVAGVVGIAVPPSFVRQLKGPAPWLARLR